MRRFPGANDHTGLVDALRESSDGTFDSEFCNRAAWVPNKTMLIAVGRSISPGDRTGGADAGGASQVTGIRCIERRDRAVRCSYKAVRVAGGIVPRTGNDIIVIHGDSFRISRVFHIEGDS